MSDDVALVGLDVSDPPGRWGALGFGVGDDGVLHVAGVMVTLGVAPPGRGIVGWSLSGVGDGDVAGLPTRPGRAAGADAHPNRVVGIDHVVVTTPSLDVFGDALSAAGLPLRRRAEIRGARMGFRRLGGPILEAVEDPSASAPAFWGVTFAVASAGALDDLCDRVAFVGAARPAVQPGRRIATVSAQARLSTRVAFIDPEPRAAAD